MKKLPILLLTLTNLLSFTASTNTYAKDSINNTEKNKIIKGVSIGTAIVASVAVGGGALYYFLRPSKKSEAQPNEAQPNTDDALAFGGPAAQLAFTAPPKTSSKEDTREGSRDVYGLNRLFGEEDTTTSDTEKKGADTSEPPKLTQTTSVKSNSKKWTALGKSSTNRTGKVAAPDSNASIIEINEEVLKAAKDGLKKTKN